MGTESNMSENCVPRLWLFAITPFISRETSDSYFSIELNTTLT
jgi:hypothetical protein